MQNKIKNIGEYTLKNFETNFILLFWKGKDTLGICSCCQG